MPNSSRLRALALCTLTLLFARPLAAQSPAARPAAPISDNSFLVEEAYNQETGVVQHILNYRRDRAGDWLATFTQEWPAPSQRDQLSYTLPLQSAAGGGSRLGDVIVNYRRQVLGADDDPIWFSPRLSVIVPTGSVSNGTGAGGPGVQVNLPLSVRVTEQLVTHWNAGGTLTRARTDAGVRSNTRSVNAAASAIWLLSTNFNVMLESAWDRSESLDGDGRRVAANNFVLLPGVRAAINLSSGMQIVPGLGMPIGLGPSRGERELFVYLSVEHAFR
ncbi:MAG TPA: hypothetical protein VGP25_11585 [Gemmatimonadaceae bacterium]|jgi:hypothetical protein|nr:hypothetical protein [Gemmatimonadaceae bacterium]